MKVVYQRQNSNTFSQFRKGFIWSSSKSRENVIHGT